MALACLALLMPAGSARSTSAVDVVLVLAIDVSSSVDAGEFDLQRYGLAAAFRNPAVVKAIARGPTQRIAVATVQWAGYRQQQVMLAWTVLAGAADAEVYASQLAQMPRAFADGGTHIAGIIEYSAAMVLTAPFTAVRRVVDISGDGTDNISGPPHAARNGAVAAGVIINGLAIANEEPALTHYYRDAVIGGPGAFVVAARNYDDYPRAILMKLIREIDTRLII